MLTKHTFCYKHFFKNRNISEKLKSIIKDKTLTYASETWILTERDRKQMNIFERKVCRGILGPVYDMKKKTGRYLPIKNFVQLFKNHL